MGVRQGCPLSPTLFGIFFDGLHDHLHSCAPMAGMQLGSGRWLSSLVYADDVVLLSWSPSGLQLLLDSMGGFCLGLGLVIVPPRQRLLSPMVQARRVHGMLAARLYRNLPASSTLA